MKLHLTTSENNHLMTGYGDDFIEINRKRYTQPLIVLANTLIENWQVANFDHLNEESFADLIKLEPEVVLLGTGKTHRFLHPALAKNLTEKGIPLECMTTAAACRTYNILMSEGRNVAAALIF